MNTNIKTTTNIKIAAEFIADKILDQLKKDKNVLFFVPGGSAIAVTSEVAKIIKKHSHENLTVMLADERYGPIGHKDSNWQQLLEKGFDLPQAKQVSILTGDNRAVTTEKFNFILEKELEKANYIIGLFGLGKDGHTAGLLPHSEALKSQDWACSHVVSPFERITIASKTVMELDEAVIWAQGQEKWKIIKDFEKDIDINTEPVQILKRVPLLTIFTDYKKQ